MAIPFAIKEIGINKEDLSDIFKNRDNKLLREYINKSKNNLQSKFPKHSIQIAGLSGEASSETVSSVALLIILISVFLIKDSLNWIYRYRVSGKTYMPLLGFSMLKVSLGLIPLLATMYVLLYFLDYTRPLLNIFFTEYNFYINPLRGYWFYSIDNNINDVIIFPSLFVDNDFAINIFLYASLLSTLVSIRIFIQIMRLKSGDSLEVKS